MRRIALVGYGRIAESAHLPAWRMLPDVEVVAVADACADRRDQAQRELLGVRLYPDTATLLAQEAIDCLDICTPPHDHTPSILQACERRIPQIICEKPLTAAPGEFERIAAAQAQSGSQIYTINSWFQSDLHRLVTGILKEGLIGQVTSVTLRTLRPDCALGVSSWHPRWRTDPRYAGGGIVLDHGWHQLYLMAAWVGDSPARVEASLQTLQAHHAPVEDAAILDLTFPHAQGRIELSWAAPARVNDGEIVGTLGRIEIADEGLTVHSRGVITRYTYGERLSDSSYHPDWFRTLFTKILNDRRKMEGTRNLQEAEMLLNTLFAAYGGRSTLANAS